MLKYLINLQKCDVDFLYFAFIAKFIDVVLHKCIGITALQKLYGLYGNRMVHGESEFCYHKVFPNLSLTWESHDYEQHSSDNLQREITTRSKGNKCNGFVLRKTFEPD